LTGSAKSLKNLSNSLDPLSVIKVKEEVTMLDKAARVQAYMNAIAKANYHAVEEAMEMSEPAKSLEEVLERTGITARAQERKALDIAQNLVNMGISFETVVSATELDPEKVKALYDK
jgi:hydroxylamine reductase (hybrid-cluster protein)